MLDAGVTDAGLSDGGGPSGLTLRDGGFVPGSIAARYDHRRWWWTPSNRTTWALLDPRGFAPWPDDRSLRFYESSELAADPAPLTIPAPAVYDFMRDAGLTLEQPPLDGVSFVITGNEGYHLDEDGYGDFAWDLVRVGADGGRFRGAGLTNADYEIWDAPVVLPTGGLVIEVENGAPDNAPGSYDAGATNNLVGVHLAGGYSLYLLHFRQGTIPTPDAGCEPALPGVRCVEPGRVLPAGTYLGRVGNSGVSLEPHLHATVLFFGPDAGRGWSVPSGFSNLHLSRGDAGASLHPFVVPRSGDLLSGRPF